MTETPDPLAGSYFVESLTNELEAAAWAYLDEIEAMGGTLAAIEGGFQQRQIQESAYRVQQAIERGDQVVVGVNKFRDDEVRSARRSSGSTPRASGARSSGVRRVRAERRPSRVDGRHGRARASGARRGQPDAGDDRRPSGPTRRSARSATACGWPGASTAS